MSNPQTVPDLFQKTKREWIDGARSVAVKLLRKRSSITIEDVLEAYPRPKYLHRNATGSVFHSAEFQPIGYTASRRRLSHGRTIRVWTLADDYAGALENACE